MATRAGAYARIEVTPPSIADQAPLNDTIAVADTAGDGGLTFVDLVGAGAASPDSLDRLTTAIQENAHRAFTFDTVIVRWPWIAEPGKAGHKAQILQWLARLTGGDGSPQVAPAHVRIGVLQHRIGAEQVLTWADDRDDADVVADDRLLAQARALELHSLLRNGKAIRTPATYHFRLPNGDHAGSFVRLADGITCPRDAWALATWLTPRLRDGAGVVIDNGSMTPIVVQLEAFAALGNWELSRVSVLSTYPAARTSVRATVESAIDISGGEALIGIQSVSSSGGLARLFEEELQRASDQYSLGSSLDILVDLRASADQCMALDRQGEGIVTRWLGFGEGDEFAGASPCELCSDPDRAAVSAIDPTSYLELPYARPRQVMPDKSYAEAAQGLWQRIDQVQGVAFDANPHPSSKVARGKRTPLPVRPFFELIGMEDGLAKAIQGRAGKPGLRPLRDTGLVVATGADLESVRWPAFAGEGSTDLRASLRGLLAGLEVPRTPIIVDDQDPEFGDLIRQTVKAGRSILAFSWAAVTGLTLRRLKLAIADQLIGQTGARVNGLVLMSRPADPADWDAARNQFRPGVLVDLWSACFPWRSPALEEYAVLDRSGIDESALTEEGKAFLARRRRFLRYHSEGTRVAEEAASTAEEGDRVNVAADDWSPRFGFHETGGPHPTEVFWGMGDGSPHQDRVRGHSLYGRELTLPTAFAAIGSVVNYTRFHESGRGSPSWVAFNMNRLVRSYFDAIIMCSVLRWLRPGEPWWYGDHGQQSEDAIDAIRFLIDQVPDVNEQVLLIPELLLATAQGKVPSAAREEVRRRAREIAATWPATPELSVARGAVDLGLLLTSDPANPTVLAGDAGDVDVS